MAPQPAAPTVSADSKSITSTIPAARPFTTRFVFRRRTKVPAGQRQQGHDSLQVLLHRRHLVRVWKCRDHKGCLFSHGKGHFFGDPRLPLAEPATPPFHEPSEASGLGSGSTASGRPTPRSGAHRLRPGEGDCVLRGLERRAAQPPRARGPGKLHRYRRDRGAAQRPPEPGRHLQTRQHETDTSDRAPDPFRGSGGWWCGWRSRGWRSRDARG